MPSWRLPCLQASIAVRLNIFCLVSVSPHLPFASGAHPHGSELTETEAAIYDRQIRLWGVEAQRRMRASRVLVSGCGALGAEVIKNLVLAGINVTVQDDAAVTPRDVGVQFFLRDEHLGRNVRAAAKEGVISGRVR